MRSKAWAKAGLGEERGPGAAAGGAAALCGGVAGKVAHHSLHLNLA